MPSQAAVRSVSSTTDLPQREPLWQGYNIFYKRTLPPGREKRV